MKLTKNQNLMKKRSTRNGDPELHQNRSHGPKAKQGTKSRLETLCTKSFIITAREFLGVCRSIIAVAVISTLENGLERCSLYTKYLTFQDFELTFGSFSSIVSCAKTALPKARCHDFVDLVAGVAFRSSTSIT